MSQGTGTRRPPSQASTRSPGAAPNTPPPPDLRTPQQIEADLAATRARLTGRIEQLQAYVMPKAVVGRQIDKVRAFYVDQYGGVRPERVLATAGAAALVVGLFVLRRRHRH